MIAVKPASQLTQTVVWDVSVPDTSQGQLSSPLCYFLYRFSGSVFKCARYLAHHQPPFSEAQCKAHWEVFHKYTLVALLVLFICLCIPTWTGH